jgi:broad specificity phosphatase PhoE
MMMVEITLIAHARTADNERGVASGHNDVDLSEAGVRQAHALAELYADSPVDVVFCSDLRRAYRTADLVFSHRAIPIIRDARLREADYGELTQHSHREVVHADHVSAPFPGGESYEQVMARMGRFFEDLFTHHDGQRVVIIGHRATNYGLEHWINGIPIADAVAQFQPRRSYTYLLSRSPVGD